MATLLRAGVVDHELLGIFVKRLLASQRAKVILLPLVLGLAGRRLFIDVHTTYGILSHERVAFLPPLAALERAGHRVELPDAPPGLSPEENLSPSTHRIHERSRHGPRQAAITSTAVPQQALCRSSSPGGTTGVVQRKSRQASAGVRLMQPRLRGVPKSLCQYVPCNAIPVQWIYATHGTPGRSKPLPSVAVVCRDGRFWRTSKWPTGVSVPGRPVEKTVERTAAPAHRRSTAGPARNAPSPRRSATTAGSSTRQDRRPAPPHTA